MALLSLLFGEPQKAQIGVMQLDASINESHSRTAVPTRSEIEDGSTIADHIKLEPKKLTITGVIAESPVGRAEALLGLATAGLISGAQGAIGGLAGNVAGTALGSGLASISGLVSSDLGEDANGQVIGRSKQDALAYLEELWSQRTPFEVITALTKYENMIITNLDIPREAIHGDSLEFTVEMEEIRIVTSSAVQIPTFQLADDAELGASSGKLGNQATKAAKAGTQSDASLALQLVRGAGIGI